MYTRHGNRLFLLVALVVAFALLLTINTSALAQRPAPTSFQDRIETGAKPSADPNAPANLAKLITSNATVRVIVQLAAAPVATYSGGTANLAATAVPEGKRLDAESAPALAYANYLSQQQDKVFSAVAAKFSSAQLLYKYQLAFNGLAVKVPASAIPAIQAMDGVRSVTVERSYEMDMDASLPIIGLYNGAIGAGTDQGIWKLVGGHANAGKGIKIADIDSGIDQKNPFFSPLGFAYPFGFPRGDVAYTTPKVIVARAYFRPDDPPNLAAGECACPRDVYSGHGSHTAGTMAGRFGTKTPFDNTKISGIAPAAWLMNYKVFYHSVSGSDSAYDVELLKALEDVIKDKADVVNNSWGGTAIDYATDPLTVAYQNATATGLIVVFSAGNNGPSTSSIGTPGAGEKLITVGASSTNRVFAHNISVVGGDTSVTNLVAVEGNGPAITSDIPATEYVDSNALSGNLLGCTAFPAGSMTGKIALIKRGSCTFSVKVNNATAAGAIAVVIWNNVAGWPSSMSVPGTTVPSVMVSMGNGMALQTWLAANPGAQMTIGAALSRLTDDSNSDWIASFSSRGPNSALLIKPDLAAPGVNILSAESPLSLSPYIPGFALYQGTSMASPHVTGMAALVHQLHPGWPQWMVKSALVNTAEEPAALDAHCTDVVGAPVPLPMCRGAGRLTGKNPGGPAKPGIVLNPASISLQSKFANSGTYTSTVSVKSVLSASETYAITIVPGASDPNLIISTDPSVTVDPGATEAVDVEFEIDNVAPGDYWGQINFDGPSHNVHMMYWVRVLAAPAVTNKGLLLIDDDSSNTRGFADYRAAYTSALNGLGIAYDVYETETLNCSSQPWDLGRFYDKVLWFTGDSSGYHYYCDFGFETPNIYGANLFFANGGRLLATGQQIGYREFVGNGRNGSSSTSPNDLALYFGAQYRQTNVFGSGLPTSPSAQAVADYNPFLGNMKIDFSAGAGGAANQASVDELDAKFYSDTDALPLFKSYSTQNIGQGLVGTRQSSEPTLERTRKGARPEDWTVFSYRTEFLSFGMEGLKPADMTALLPKLLDWLDDTLTISNVTPVAATVKRNYPAQLTVTAASSKGTIYYYRVDWGDGTTPSYFSDPAKIMHGYTLSGIYKVRVEVMDVFGHKAVWGSPVKITVP